MLEEKFIGILYVALPEQSAEDENVVEAAGVFSDEFDTYEEAVAWINEHHQDYEDFVCAEIKKIWVRPE